MGIRLGFAIVALSQNDFNRSAVTLHLQFRLSIICLILLSLTWHQQAPKQLLFGAGGRIIQTVCITQKHSVQ